MAVLIGQAKTLELFGEKAIEPDGSEALRPFHLYSMRQAIEEGYILDVLRGYTSYSTYYRLANGLGEGRTPARGSAGGPRRWS